MNNQEISSPPKNNEAPNFEQTKTMSHELFYSVFNFNMVDSPCHMIFCFKKLIKFDELRYRVVKLRYRLLKSQNLLNRTFKEFNNSLDNDEPPIKNRRDLYLLLKEFYSDVKLRRRLLKSRNLTSLCRQLTDYKLMIRMMTFLTKNKDFRSEENDLALVFRNNSCYNKKCQQDLDELYIKTLLEPGVYSYIELMSVPENAIRCYDKNTYSHYYYYIDDTMGSWWVGEWDKIE